MTNSKNFKRWLDPLPMIIIFVCPIGRLIPWSELPEISDFFQYYAVSSLMQNGHYSQIYDINTILKAEQTVVPNSSHSYFPFLIPPNISWIFYPLAWLKFIPTIYIWSILLLALVVVSYSILCSHLKITGMRKLWGATLLATSGPFLESVRLGQLSPILLFALSLLYIGLKQKNYFLTIVSESIFWLKPHLLLPILCFELSPSMIQVPLLTCLFSFIGLAISCTIAGINIVPSYISLFSSSEMQSSLLGLIYGPTLRGQLLKFSISYDISSKAAIVGYLFLLILAFLNRKRAKIGESQVNIIFTSLLPFSLCLSLHLHNYDLLLLLPGILLLSTYSLSKALNYLRISIIAIVVLVSLAPIYVYLHYFYVLQNGLLNPFFWTTLIFAIGAYVIEQKRDLNQR